MAGRVNTKFVIILSAALVALLVGALGLLYYIKINNGPDLAAAGDKKLEAAKAKLAAGDAEGAARELESAEKVYSKAVNKDQTNPVFLSKWIACFETWTPLTQTQYLSNYNDGYRRALRQLSLVKRSDLAAHEAYLNLLPAYDDPGISRQQAEFTIQEAERLMDLAKATPDEAKIATAMRRHRGMMLVRMMSERGLEVSPEQMQKAKDDLDFALAAQPNDPRLILAIFSWYNAQADAARRAQRAEQAAKLEADARAVVEQGAKASSDPELAITLLATDIASRQRSAAESGDPAQFAAKTREIAAELKPRFDEVVKRFQAAEPAQLTLRALGTFQQIEALFAGNDSRAISLPLMQKAADARPKDSDLLIAIGTMLGEQGKYPEAMALFQRVADLPQPPISREGAELFGKRLQAVYLQAAYSIQKWENAVAAASPDRSGVEEAKKYRAKLGELVGSDTSQLKFVDGLISYADGNLPEAKRLLVEYNKATNNGNLKAVFTQARVDMMLNNPGAARAALESIIQRNPGIVSAQIVLAQIEMQLGNTDRSKAILEDVLLIDPANSGAKEMLAVVGRVTGAVKPTDPVEALLAEQQHVIDGTNPDPTSKAAPPPPNVRGALATLEASLETYKHDPRIVNAIILIKAGLGDKDGALAAAQAGLKANPDNAQLKTAVEALSTTDPLKWRLEQIDKAQASDLDKELQRFSLLIGSDKVDDARASLDNLTKMAPDDPRVLEIRFRDVLAKRDFAAAGSIAEAATKVNADRLGGAFFRARVLAAQQQNNESIAILKGLSDNGTATVECYRLLARLYTSIGRPDESNEAYLAALRLRPNDVATLVDYVDSLARQGSLERALLVTRENNKAGRNSPQFVDLWLTFEAQVGNRVFAIEQRKLMLVNEPGNLVNKLALAGLYMDVKRWAEARKLIDELIKAAPGLEVAALDARFYAQQGELDKAAAVVDKYLNDLKTEDRTIQAFVVMARVFTDVKAIERALAILECAKPLQDPKVMEVDRLIGDTLSQASDASGAIAAYQRVVDANADGQRQEVRMRIAELLIALKKYQEAGAQLDKVTNPASPMTLALMRADVASGLGDDRKAQQAYDRAVQDFATDPTVYMRRALWQTQRNPARFDDAVTDLDAALRVRPGYWQARQFKANILVRQNRIDDAARELREVLKANPLLDDLRIQLMQTLILRERAGEAAEVAEEAVATRKNDLNLHLSIGGVFLARQDWQRARQYIGQAWVLEQSPEIAQAYLDAMLNSEPPDLTNARLVLSSEVVQKVISKSPFLLLARSKMLAKQRGGLRDAAPDLLASFGALDSAKPAEVMRWFAEVQRFITKDADLISFFDRGDIPPTMREWAAFLKASTQGKELATMAGAQKSLEQLSKEARSVEVRDAAFRLWGEQIYAVGGALLKQGKKDEATAKFQEAVGVWTKGIAEFPKSWQMLNNTAYALGVDLAKPQEALEFAERAAKEAPLEYDPLDTLGTVYLALQKYPDAEDLFRRAYGVSKSVRDRLITSIHISAVYIATARKKEAREQLDFVENTLRATVGLQPELVEQIQNEAKELRKKLDSP